MIFSFRNPGKVIHIIHIVHMSFFYFFPLVIRTFPHTGTSWQHKLAILNSKILCYTDYTLKRKVYFMSTTIEIKDSGTHFSTLVPDLFIDQYMNQANGEFVKIYLYLLRIMHKPGADLSLSSIADIFSCTEKDVMRGLNYWQKAGLLDLEYDDSQNLSRIALLPCVASTPEAEPVASSPVEFSAADHRTCQAPNYLSPGAILKLKQENPDIGQLLFLSEQYLSKTLTATDMQRILYFYDELHFPVELIEYLIEYCVSQNHRSLNYIEKVGLAWHSEQIHTVEAAKQRTNTWNKDYFLILKAFGIRGRDPIATETEYMNRWLKEYGFSIDIIKEACSRTIAQTAQPNFKYAEGILSKWSKEHVKTPGDIQKLDELHQQRSQSAEKAAETRKKNANKFNNFHQREYDFAKLEKQLLNQ